MKQFKNLMLMLALALFFVGAMNVTKASAATATPDYNNEYIVVTGVGEGEAVYYQVVKSAEPGELKPANWIPAACEGNAYYIDFSATSNNKDAYIAWTTDNAVKSGSVVPLNAKIKSVKVNLDYAAEELTDASNLDEIIKTVTVKGVDPADDKKDVEPANYVFLWKRGANGNWKNEKDFSQLEWDMVRASNATLYISIAGGDGEKSATLTDGKYEYRVSKEAKVKIPKAAKAPNVKIDFAKGTVALKNGMQVKKADADWVTVLPVTKDEKVTETKIFGNATELTKTKVSSVAVGDLLKALEITDKAKDVELEVRTAATEKKFPSNIGTLKFKTPAQNPAVNGEAEVFMYTKADSSAKVAAEFTIDFAEILQTGTDTKYELYEYILLDDAAAKVDLTKQKWTKITAGGKVDLKSKVTAKAKYVEIGGETKEFDYIATKAILVRKAADKDNDIFPSEHTVAPVTMTEALTYTITLPTNVTGLEKISYKVGTGKATKAKEGETVTLAMELAEGYTVKSVKAGDTDATLTEGVYSFKMPKANVTVTVELNAPANDGGGDAG